MKPINIQPATTPAQHRFHLLDALRGIAALLVVPRHMSSSFIDQSYSSFFAVDFFFCLSGFVVAFAYEQRLRATMTFREFVIARLIRLYPFAALGTFFGLLEFLQINSHHLHDMHWLWAIQLAVSGFLILPTLNDPNAYLFPLDFVMWTLFFELVANIFFALLVRLKIASSWVLGVIAICFFLLLVQQRLLFGIMDIGWKPTTILGGLARVGFSFFTGVLLYRLFRQYRGSRAQIRSSLAALLATVLMIAALTCPPSIAASATGGLLLIGVVFPVLVYCGACIAVPDQWVSLCAFLGTISYPLYILHHVLVWPLGFRKAESFAASHSFLVTRGIAVVCLAIMVALMWLLSKYYDVPVRRKLTSWFSTKAAGKAVLVQKG